MKKLKIILALSAGIACATPIVAHFLDKTTSEVAISREHVKSSNIASIGYDAASLTLEVEFTTGAVYQYFNVPQSIYEGLMSAQSHGTYFWSHVRRGGYAYKRIN